MDVHPIWCHRYTKLDQNTENLVNFIFELKWGRHLVVMSDLLHSDHSKLNYWLILATTYIFLTTYVSIVKVMLSLMCVILSTGWVGYILSRQVLSVRHGIGYILSRSCMNRTCAGAVWERGWVPLTSGAS